MIVTIEGEAQPPVAAIVLAAGGSIRMGRLKQLLPVDGQPMVRRVTQTVVAAGLAQVIVVIGAQADRVREVLHDLPVEIVVNEQWPAGMSRSLRAGLQAVQPEIQAALIVLADQPTLTPPLLQKLVARYQATRAAIVTPFYQGRQGNPVLFDRSLFAELVAVEGDQGGRSLLARYQAQIERVEVDDPAVILDIDTRDEYEQLHH
ncbi:MAG: molybdenum cofactor cytidylyltransferase [Anaerolineae bacterium]